MTSQHAGIGPFPNTDLEPYITIMTEDKQTTEDKPESVFEYLLGRAAQGYAQNDPVNHPEHYKSGGIETIDVLQAKLSAEEFQGYCLGNALKYLTRRHYKGKPEEDLKKAKWYLDRALEQVKSPGHTDLMVTPESGMLAVPIPVKDPLDTPQPDKHWSEKPDSIPVITTYPGQKTRSDVLEKTPGEGEGECIQPGCTLSRTHDRLYCLDHRFSKGKSMDKEVPDGK